MTDSPHTGTCHCGAVHITLPRTPDYVNDCNCSLCTKLGGLWAYYNVAEVKIEAAPDAITAYLRADLDETYLTTNHCAICGCTTHWAPLPDKPQDRMGVNVRLFGEEMMAGVEVRKVDGRGPIYRAEVE